MRLQVSTKNLGNRFPGVFTVEKNCLLDVILVLSLTFVVTFDSPEFLYCDRECMNIL